MSKSSQVRDIRTWTTHKVEVGKFNYYFITHVDPSNEKRMRMRSVSFMDSSSDTISLDEEKANKLISRLRSIPPVFVQGQDVEENYFILINEIWIGISQDDIFEKVANSNATDTEKTCQDVVKNELEILELLKPSLAADSKESDRLYSLLRKTGLSETVVDAIKHKIKDQEMTLRSIYSADSTHKKHEFLLQRAIVVETELMSSENELYELKKELKALTEKREEEIDPGGESHYMDLPTAATQAQAADERYMEVTPGDGSHYMDLPTAATQAQAADERYMKVTPGDGSHYMDLPTAATQTAKSEEVGSVNATPRPRRQLPKPPAATQTEKSEEVRSVNATPRPRRQLPKPPAATAAHNPVSRNELAIQELLKPSSTKIREKLYPLLRQEGLSKALTDAIEYRITDQEYRISSKYIDFTTDNEIFEESYLEVMRLLAKSKTEIEALKEELKALTEKLEEEIDPGEESHYMDLPPAATQAQPADERYMEATPGDGSYYMDLPTPATQIEGNEPGYMKILSRPVMRGSETQTAKPEGVGSGNTTPRPRRQLTQAPGATTIPGSVSRAARRLSEERNGGPAC